MWLKVWRFLKPFHRDFLWFLVMMAIYQVLGVVNGYRLSFIIDNVESHRDDSWFWLVFFTAVVVFDLLYVIVNLQVDWHIVTRHDYPIDRYTRLTGIEFLMEMDPAWHEDRESGTLIGNVNNGGDKIGSFVSTLSWEFVPALVEIAICFIPLALISHESVIAVVVCMPIFVAITILSNRKRNSLRVDRYELYDRQWALIQEMVQSVDTLRAYGQINEVVRLLRKIADAIVEIGKKEFKISMFYNALRVAVLHTTWILVIFLWERQLATGSATVAQIVYANTLFGSVMGQIWKYVTLLDRAFDYGEPIRKYLNLFAEQVCIPDTGIYEDSPKSVDVQFRNVSFSYGGLSANGRTIDDVSFAIHPGQRVALVGLSGGGKTTIMKLLMRSLEASSGEVIVNGVNVTKWQRSSLRRLFAYIPAPQSAAIFSAEVPGEGTGTVEYNVIIGNSRASHEDVIVVMKMVGLHDFVMSLPNGYKTKVGEHGVKLSSGQIQRILIARAIIAGARILIMDEPTSNIDAQLEYEIMEELNSRLMRENISVLTSAHRLTTTMGYDQILVVAGGKIVERGTHRDLLNSDGVYASLWRKQLGTL